MEEERLQELRSNRDLLVLGDSFIKHGRRGNPHERFVSVSSSLQFLEWKDAKNEKREIRRFDLRSVKQVVEGIMTDVSRRTGKSSDSHLIFSLLSSDRSFDLQAKSVEQKNRWSVLARCLFLTSLYSFRGCLGTYPSIMRFFQEKKSGGLALFTFFLSQCFLLPPFLFVVWM